MNNRLAERRVLITGGGTGIGSGIAECFLQEGAKVVICGRRHGPLVKTVERLSEISDAIYPLECDISDPADVDAMFKKVKELIGGLDILVNNAAIYEDGNLETTELKVWDRIQSVNLRGAMLVTRAAMPMLKDSGAGANVVNISSTMAQVAEQDNLAYSVSKAGLDMFTRCCAIDYAEDGIRFNAVAPAIIDTPMQDRSKADLGYHEWRAQMSFHHPLGGVGLPRDVAAAALFLASSEAGWVTGVILPVDGGQTAR